MESKLSQIQTQKLILAPQLRQFLKLLELPIFELEQKIQEELEQNPVLEEIKSEATEDPLRSETNPSANETPESNSTQVRDVFQEIENFENIRKYQDFTEDFSQDDLSETQKKRDYQESILTKPPTLNEYLTWQLSLLELSEKEKIIAQEIIGNINDDGQLISSCNEIAKALEMTDSQVEEVLKKIQTLDPPGVGGRDLKEILLIQLRKQGNDTALAQKIVADYLPLLERKHFDQIARLMKIPPQKIAELHNKIARLEPKPGRIFYQEKPNFVIPDASVSPSNDDENELVIEMNHDYVPQLRISPIYRQMIKQKDLDAATKNFLREKIQHGLDLIKAIGQRKSTLRQITDELIKAQRDFFTKGFASLKPLRLKDVAEKIGVHESTISRAIQNKYIDTPQGTIPYKSFFSSKLESENGLIESQKSVMERLKHLIATENKRKPLSDAKLVNLLKLEGITIARRTVAKYRDLLKILPAHLRKER